MTLTLAPLLLQRSQAGSSKKRNGVSCLLLPYWDFMFGFFFTTDSSPDELPLQSFC